MKKLLLLLIPCLGIIFYSTSGLIFFTAEKNGQYSVYAEKYPAQEYNLTAKEAYSLCLKENEKGISVKLSDGADYRDVINNLLAEEKFSEYVDGLLLFYYHSPYLKNYVNLRGEKINLQIALNPNGTVIVGTPLIMGSI